MPDLIEVLNSLRIALVHREQQIERCGNQGKKYCRDRLLVERDKTKRQQVKALKKTHDKGWKQAAEELTYFEDWFDEAVEWCADETEFTPDQIVKAVEVQFHPSRLKPKDRLYYQAVRELIPALKNLSPDEWTETAWAKSILMPKSEASIPSGVAVWQFNDGTVTFKGVTFSLCGREYDVLQLLATSGNTTDAFIGDELGITTDNVRTYLSKAGKEIRKHFDVTPDRKGRELLCELTPIGKQNRRRLRSEALQPKSTKSRKSTASPTRLESKKSLTISKKKRPRNS